MNEEIEKQVAEFLLKALEAAEKTGEFVIDKAPELVQQFYMMRTIKHSMWLVGIIVVILSVGLFVRRQGRKYDWDFDEVSYGVPLCIFWGITSLLSICFVVELYGLLFLIVAPDLYLLEYFIK